MFDGGVLINVLGQLQVGIGVFTCNIETDT